MMLLELGMVLYCRKSKPVGGGPVYSEQLPACKFVSAGRKEIVFGTDILKKIILRQYESLKLASVHFPSIFSTISAYSRELGE